MIDSEKRVYIKTDKLEVAGADRVVSGRFSVGEYGYTRDVVDVEKLEERPLSLGGTKAVCEPFYYRLFIPKGKKSGLLLLQRSGNVGVVSYVRDALKKRFEEEHSDLILFVNPLVPDELVKELNKAETSELEAVYYYPAGDASDKDKWGGCIQNYGKVTVRFSAPLKDKLKLAWTGKPAAIELPGLGEPGRVTVKVDYRGRLRTLDFLRPDRISPWIDVTDDLTEHGGHPTFKSLEEFADAWQADLADQLDLKDD